MEKLEIFLLIFLLLSSIILYIISIIININTIISINKKTKPEKIHRVFIPTNRKKEEYYNKYINKNHE